MNEPDYADELSELGTVYGVEENSHYGNVLRNAAFTIRSLQEEAQRLSDDVDVLRQDCAAKDEALDAALAELGRYREALQALYDATDPMADYPGLWAAALPARVAAGRLLQPEQEHR